jgi:hypothetical protein
VAVGCSNRDVKKYGGRVETFEIADDERLIGAELACVVNDDGKDYFKGVTWIKMKVNF